MTTIVFRCDKCDQRYQVPLDRAGQVGVCRLCGAKWRVPVPDGPPEVTEGGSLILRHRVSEETPLKELVADSVSPDAERLGDHHLDQVTEHIERHLGAVEIVLQDKRMGHSSMDVLVIRPRSDRPFYVLTTLGMSQRAMHVPAGLDSPRYAELVMGLPEDWPMTKEDFRKPVNFWPIELLRTLASMPHLHQTWLDIGHTIPNGDPAEPYLGGTKLNCALIARPRALSPEFCICATADPEVVFHAVYLLHPSEMQFKLKNGFNALMERFDEAQVTEVFAPQRPSCCRSWWQWGAE